MMKKILFLSLTFFLALQLSGQSVNGLIFQTKSDINPLSLEADLIENSSFRDDKIEIKSIYKASNLYKISSEETSVLKLKEYLSRQDQILWVVEDQPLELRINPNDEHYDKQWYIDQIKADDAWNITTGGLTPNGDTIVLAVLDDGFMADHFDLAENIWHNWNEIPNDEIDNDGNGYTDDHLGLNLKTSNDLHTVKKHGTSVSGIMGASGNNSNGIAGVSWNVKIMLISEATSISNVIEGYQYILDARKRFNESGGQEGAYIVASNLSAGIDNVFPHQNPLYEQWCKLYEDLGEQGILSVNATTNYNTNIDIEGDMPGTCGSEFLITVTNSNSEDQKVENAGYGVQSIDMAAPGEDIFTLSLSNSFDSFSGASSSAPQVTGAIGLFYAAPCKDFADFAKNDPESGARSIKNMLMTSVDKNDNLNSFTKSGGRINVLEGVNQMRDYCAGTTGELEIKMIYPNPASSRFTIEYETDNFEPHRFLITDVLGRVVHQENIIPNYFGKKILTFDIYGLKKSPYTLGFYIVSISDGKQFASKKLMIE